MLHVLGMVAEPDEVPAPRQIDQLEPWLVRDGKDQRLVRQFDEPLQDASGLIEMLHDLKGERDVVASAVEGWIEDVGVREAQRGPPCPRRRKRVVPQVDALIGSDVDAEMPELVEGERLAASEIQDVARGQRPQFIGERGVEAAEAETV